MSSLLEEGGSLVFPFISSGLQAVAATPAAGFALQNATPNVITWTAPNDGALHRFTIFSSLVIASLETGGAITYFYTPPGIAQQSHTLYAAAQGAGAPLPTNLQPLIIAAGTAVIVQQSSALTGGAATLYAEIWGS